MELVGRGTHHHLRVWVSRGEGLTQGRRVPAGGQECAHDRRLPSPPATSFSVELFCIPAFRVESQPDNGLHPYLWLWILSTAGERVVCSRLWVHGEIPMLPSAIGGSAGNSHAPPLPTQAFARDEHSRTNLFLLCLRWHRNKTYMHKGWLRVVASLLQPRSVTTPAERVPVANEVVVFMENLSGLNCATLSLTSDSSVQDLKEAFVEEYKRTYSGPLSAHVLRVFADGERLLENNTISLRQARIASHSTMLFLVATRGRDILEQFYDETEGQFWRKNVNRIGWKKPCHVKEWEGVHCSLDGKAVEGLIKVKCGLTGEQAPVFVCFWFVLVCFFVVLDCTG